MGTTRDVARARALAALDRHDNADWSAPPDDEAWELLRAVIAEADPAETPGDYVDIVFDGPPDHTAGRFVEVEDSTGRSIRFGHWVKRPDRMWVLRIAREERTTLDQIRARIKLAESWNRYLVPGHDGALIDALDVDTLLGDLARMVGDQS